MKMIIIQTVHGEIFPLRLYRRAIEATKLPQQDNLKRASSAIDLAKDPT